MPTEILLPIAACVLLFVLVALNSFLQWRKPKTPEEFLKAAARRDLKKGTFVCARCGRSLPASQAADAAYIATRSGRNIRTQYSGLVCAECVEKRLRRRQKFLYN